MRHENFDTAMLYLHKAHDEQPDDADTLADIGLCQLRQGDDAAALTSARKALALDPENPDAMLCIAMVYDSRDNIDAASDYFERLIDSQRCNEGHCRFYTLFLFSHGIYDVLADFADESLQIYPHDTFYSTYLAAAYFYTNRYNRFRRLLPDVLPSVLHELCPEAWYNPALAPLLEVLNDNNKQQNQ